MKTNPSLPASSPRRRIRVDVRLSNGAGFRRRFEDWQAAAAWMASPGFLDGAHNVRSVHLGGRGEFPGGTQ